METSEITLGLLLMDRKKTKFKINKGETVEKFIRMIAEKNELYRELLLDQKGEIKNNFMITINHRMIPVEEKLSTILNDGDDLEIVFLARGG